MKRAGRFILGGLLGLLLGYTLTVLLPAPWAHRAPRPRRRSGEGRPEEGPAA